MITYFCTICYHEGSEKEAPKMCSECGADPKSLLQMESVDEQKLFDRDQLPQNLEAARDIARKKLKGICAVYPECDGTRDRICQREAYGKPIGFGGAGSGASFAAM